MQCGEYKIDLGCGPQKREGFIGVDIADYSSQYPNDDFYVVDFEKGVLPFCTNSAVYLLADNVLEHIVNLIPFMNECHRILKANGIFEIIVPVAATDGDFGDPTHVRHFNHKTFSYFEPSVRQENYAIKPWGFEFKDANSTGKIEVRMSPIK